MDDGILGTLSSCIASVVVAFKLHAAPSPSNISPDGVSTISYDNNARPLDTWKYKLRL